MQYDLSNNVIADLQKISTKNIKLLQKIEKQLQLFEQNHKHPSLRTHKLQGKLGQSWSISIEMNIRMMYRIIHTEEGMRAFFYAIGTHDQVYRKS